MRKEKKNEEDEFIFNDYDNSGSSIWNDEFWGI